MTHGAMTLHNSKSYVYRYLGSYTPSNPHGKILLIADVAETVHLCSLWEYFYSLWYLPLQLFHSDYSVLLFLINCYLLVCFIFLFCIFTFSHCLLLLAVSPGICSTYLNQPTTFSCTLPAFPASLHTHVFSLSDHHHLHLFPWSLIALALLLFVIIFESYLSLHFQCRFRFSCFCHHPLFLSICVLSVCGQHPSVLILFGVNMSCTIVCWQSTMAMAHSTSFIYAVMFLALINLTEHWISTTLSTLKSCGLTLLYLGFSPLLVTFC